VIVDQYFVAFLDILGFSAKVESDFMNAEVDDKSNLESIRQAILAARAIGDVDAQIAVQQFSDSIIISTKFSRAAFPVFLEACSKMQAELAGMRILLRGGLAYGKHYAEDGILYSKALIEAYGLESTDAIYPRVIISQDLFSLMYPDGAPEDDALIEDSDRYFYINYKKHLEKDKLAGLSEWAGVEHEKFRGRVAAKFSWLRSYLANT
jgi:hypothetical protein